MGGQGSGGYKQPSNPATVSGPGALSQRTDGGAIDGQQAKPEYSGFEYSENKDLRTQADGAAIAGNPFAGLTSLEVPTQFPNVPVQSGIDRGPGNTSRAIKLPGAQLTALQIMANLAQLDASGDTELIYRMLEEGNA